LNFAGTTYTGVGAGSVGFELTTSDRRLKERLQKISTPLDTLAKLKGVYYYWTKESQARHNYDTRRHLGFLAQDVADALPEAVDTITDGQYLGVDYQSIVPLLTEGIKDLSKQVDILQQKNTDLEKLMDSFERRSTRKLRTVLTETDTNTSNINLEKLEQRLLNAMEYKRTQERPYEFVFGALVVSVLYFTLYAIHTYMSKQRQTQIHINTENTNITQHNIA